jgi:hypothetical protein
MSIVPAVEKPPAYVSTRNQDTPEEREDVEAIMKRNGCPRVRHEVDEHTGVLRSYGYPQ